MPDPHVLVVGAGPTGLAAALFLRRREIPVRIIDQAGAPSSTSRALVVNPRTLELLADTGITSRMLAAGHPLSAVRFYQQWKPIAQLEFGHLHARYGMLVLSQARTEQYLAEALAELGIFAERNTQLTSLSQDAEAVEVNLALAGAAEERARTDIVFGADGVHSRVRDCLDLEFPGGSFPETWMLEDLELDTELELPMAHVNFCTGGLFFALALERSVWRVFANLPDLHAHLPPGSRMGSVHWQSAFRISHRVAAAPAVSRVALGGDAAHVHSPLGARGMNLGIEDAWVFASHVEATRQQGLAALTHYGRERHAVHRRVVRLVQALTRIGRGRPAPVRMMRRVLFPLATGWAPTARFMERAVSGLDHVAQ